jgi:hypothetical protein
VREKDLVSDNKDPDANRIAILESWISPLVLDLKFIHCARKRDSCLRRNDGSVSGIYQINLRKPVRPPGNHSISIPNVGFGLWPFLASYSAYNPNENFNQSGIELIVTVRKTRNNEHHACTMLGPGYPMVTVIKAEPKKSL